MLATGGSIVRYRENGTNFIAHIFTNSAAAETLTFSSDTNVEYLVVAGGGAGGGGWNGAGGGAGGVRIGSTNLPADTYTIMVGAGGIGNTDVGAAASNSTIVGTAINLFATTGAVHGAASGRDYSGGEATEPHGLRAGAEGTARRHRIAGESG